MSDRNDSTAVEYREIPRLPGYRFGSDGTAWSCWKRAQAGYHKGIVRVPGDKWIQLKTKVVGDYFDKKFHYYRKRPRTVALFVEGKRRDLSLGRVILEAFVGPCPDGMQCCHYDDNRDNNNISNLRWDTHQGNVADRARNGGNPVGEKNHFAKLNESDIPEIIRLSRDGLSQPEVGKIFGINRATVGAIVRREIWSHLEI